MHKFSRLSITIASLLGALLATTSRRFYREHFRCTGIVADVATGSGEPMIKVAGEWLWWESSEAAPSPGSRVRLTLPIDQHGHVRGCDVRVGRRWLRRWHRARSEFVFFVAQRDAGLQKAREHAAAEVVRRLEELPASDTLYIVEQRAPDILDELELVRQCELANVLAEVCLDSVQLATVESLSVCLPKAWLERVAWMLDDKVSETRYNPTEQPADLPAAFRLARDRIPEACFTGSVRHDRFSLDTDVIIEDGEARARYPGKLAEAADRIASVTMVRTIADAQEHLRIRNHVASVKARNEAVTAQDTTPRTNARVSFRDVNGVEHFLGAGCDGQGESGHVELRARCFAAAVGKALTVAQHGGDL